MPCVNFGLNNKNNNFGFGHFQLLKKYSNKNNGT